MTRLHTHSDASIRETLTRLLAIEYRSLAVYLKWACPYIESADAEAWKTIQTIATGNETLAGRIVELIIDRGWHVDYGDFPITFTGSHDLSLKFLVRRLIQWQKNMIVALDECYTGLADDPVAQSLADECLGGAKGDLETLEELLAGKPAPTAVKLHSEDEPVVAS